MDLINFAFNRSPVLAFILIATFDVRIDGRARTWCHNDRKCSLMNAPKHSNILIRLIKLIRLMHTDALCFHSRFFEDIWFLRIFGSQCSHYSSINIINELIN